MMKHDILNSFLDILDEESITFASQAEGVVDGDYEQAGVYPCEDKSTVVYQVKNNIANCSHTMRDFEDEDDVTESYNEICDNSMEYLTNLLFDRSFEKNVTQCLNGAASDFRQTISKFDESE